MGRPIGAVVVLVLVRPVDAQTLQVGAATKYPLQCLLERITELVIEISIYNRIQSRIEITNPKQYRNSTMRNHTITTAPANVLRRVPAEER